MSTTVTANSIEMHCVRHPPPDEIRRVAGLVSTVRDAILLPAEIEHLGHAWQIFELPSPVERGEDLLFRPYLDKVSGG
jgi:hypothetical protein